MGFPQNKETQKIAARLKVARLEESLCFPKYFEVETVNICNARCIMCSVNNWKKEKDAVMSQALFTKFTEEVAEYSDWIEAICLNRDGEPTLDKNLSHRVKMLKDAGIKRVTFATNGQLLKPDLVHRLIDAGLDDIMVSIDALTKKTFEAIRIGLDYDIVLENTFGLIRIRDERSSKMTVRIRMALMKENMCELENWLHFWKPKVGRQDRVYAKPMHTWGNQLGSEAEDMMAKYAEEPCISPFSTMVIKVGGKVPLCGADYNVRYALGDFSKQPIKEIWNGKHYTEFRSCHINKQRNRIDMCRGCHIWDEAFLVTDTALCAASS